MKIRLASATRPRLAFTLMELLIVISIISILAGLIIPAAIGIKNKSALNKAKSELRRVAEAIDRYKIRFGYYPPSSANNPWRNSLYFELMGSKRDGNRFTSLDGAANITDSLIYSEFGVGDAASQKGSISNCTKSNDEESKPAEKLLTEAKSNQYYQYTSGGSTLRLLVCSVALPENGPRPLAIPRVNPWAYLKNGTNHPGSYDLWVDVVVAGKTNRISNWSETAQTVYQP
jgi:prepilin-type N-terminal cleavage/methylation domain-containing protein